MTLKLQDNPENPHTFLLIVDNERQIVLSYSGFHGKTAVNALGENGLLALLQNLQSSMGTAVEMTMLNNFFSVVGVQNAILLIEAFCPDKFASLWQNEALRRKSIGAAVSFRKVLAALSGTDATLAHLRNNAFLARLKRQRAYAQSRQMDLPEKYRGYLMVSTSHPTRLLQTRDFNAALGKICEQLQLKDFEGNPVHITSHMLRHVEVCNAADTVPLEELQQACGHKTVSTTIGYGYPSVGDELQINRAIFESISKTSQESTESPTELFQCVLPRRFQKMAKNTVRFVGNDCICQETNCTPQYEYCITQCEYFVPDERYIPMAKQLCDKYEKALMNCSQNSDDIDFLKSQLNVWEVFLKRAEDSENKETQNE